MYLKIYPKVPLVKFFFNCFLLLCVCYRTIMEMFVAIEHETVKFMKNYFIFQKQLSKSDSSK